DWLRYHPIVRDIFGRYLFALENPKVSRNAQDSVRSIKTLCAAARLLHSPAKVGQVEQHILQRVATLDPSKVDWTEFVPNIEKKWIARATILKPYVGPREPGVVFIGFENEWMRLLPHVALREFAERYTLIVELAQRHVREQPHPFVFEADEDD